MRNKVKWNMLKLPVCEEPVAVFLKVDEDHGQRGWDQDGNDAESHH